MPIHAFMQAYRRVWLDQDSEGFAGLFTPDGQYWNTPFQCQDTFEKRKTYWDRIKLQQDISHTNAVLAETPFGKVGLSICYDVRFPGLYRRLARAGAEILTVPAAFNDTTGAAHWESLLRARAIENGAFVLAPAQSGAHAAKAGRPRRSWGHSMVVAPWGEVLADGGTDIGVTLAEIDLAAVAKARHRVPSLTHDREFEGP